MLELTPEEIIPQNEATKTADELLHKFDTLIEIGFEDKRIGQVLVRAKKRLSDSLEPIFDWRRQDGDLPTTGNEERSHLAAVMLTLKTKFSTTEPANSVASNLLEDLDDVVDVVNEVLSMKICDPELQQLFTDLLAALEEIRTDLNALKHTT